MQWVKPGGDAQQYSVDAAYCHAEAQRNAWLRYWPPQPLVPIVVRDAQGRRAVIWTRDPFDNFNDPYPEEFRLYNFCLMQKGYELVPIPKAN
jgi:hypothetical protein